MYNNHCLRLGTLFMHIIYYLLLLIILLFYFGTIMFICHCGVVTERPLFFCFRVGSVNFFVCARESLIL